MRGAKACCCTSMWVGCWVACTIENAPPSELDLGQICAFAMASAEVPRLPRRRVQAVRPARRPSAGAAAEPEPEPPPAAPPRPSACGAAAAAAAAYDPRDYQNPHPDDRDGGAPTKHTKGKSKSAGKGAKGNAEADASPCCAHCGAAAAKSVCSACRIAAYCGEGCQREDQERHKGACRAAVATQARQATRTRLATAAAAEKGGEIDKETCVICIGPVVAPVELPCGHAYCGKCLSELRKHGVAQVCPQCRKDFRPQGRSNSPFTPGGEEFLEFANDKIETHCPLLGHLVAAPLPAYA